MYELHKCARATQKQQHQQHQLAQFMLDLHFQCIMCVLRPDGQRVSLKRVFLCSYNLSTKPEPLQAQTAKDCLPWRLLSSDCLASLDSSMMSTSAVDHMSSNPRPPGSPLLSCRWCPVCKLLLWRLLLPCALIGAVAVPPLLPPPRASASAYMSTPNVSADLSDGHSRCLCGRNVQRTTSLLAASTAMRRPIAAKHSTSKAQQ